MTNYSNREYLVKSEEPVNISDFQRLLHARTRLGECDIVAGEGTEPWQAYRIIEPKSDKTYTVVASKKLSKCFSEVYYIIFVPYTGTEFNGVSDNFTVVDTWDCINEEIIQDTLENLIGIKV